MPRAELYELILRLARENPRCGYRRVQGELLKLVPRCSHMTVARVLRRQGLPPAPRRSHRTWRQFVRQHAHHLLAVDFFTVDTDSLAHPALRALVHRGGQPPRSPRRLHCSPSGDWVVQQARNLAWKLQATRFLLRDRDAKFNAGFDEVLRSEGVEVVRTPARSPRANAVAERWVGTARREALEHLLIFGRRHLERVMEEIIEHYYEPRPHQGLGQRCPGAPTRRPSGPGRWSAGTCWAA